MNIVLLDVSGSMVDIFDQLMLRVNPNDFLILFDSDTKVIGTARPVAKPQFGGGTDINKALNAARLFDQNANVRIISDGYFDQSPLNGYPSLNITIDLVQ